MVEQTDNMQVQDLDRESHLCGSPTDVRPRDPTKTDRIKRKLLDLFQRPVGG